MQILFTRWCLDPAGRTPVSVKPDRVENTELWSDGFTHAGTGEVFPAATKIILKNRTEYIVQGSVEQTVNTLNAEQVRQ